MEGERTDRRLEAWLHGLVHRGTPGDLDFYVRVCRGSSRVLELGCGRGRILLGLALAGYSVTGLEIDAALLEVAERGRRALPAPYAGRVGLELGDMREFRLPGRFDRILIPFSGLFCLLDDGDVRRCLANVHGHLTDDGQLVLDGYLAGPPGGEGAGEGDPAPVHLASVEDGGRRVEVFERDRWARKEQRVDATYVFHVHEAGSVRVVEQTVAQRYMYPEQVTALLEESGFTVTGTWGDFRGGHLATDSRVFVVRARPR